MNVLVCPPPCLTYPRILLPLATPLPHHVVRQIAAAELLFVLQEPSNLCEELQCTQADTTEYMNCPMCRKHIEGEGGREGGEGGRKSE